ncbi:hypothetical protein B0I35DRAFT_435173, partial [Stachybotrys elegans]
MRWMGVGCPSALLQSFYAVLCWGSCTAFHDADMTGSGWYAGTWRPWRLSASLQQAVCGRVTQTLPPDGVAWPCCER